MKTTKTFEIEIERHNVTPAQFLAYLRQMQKKHPEMACDFDINAFRSAGWCFNYSNALPSEKPCESECSIDKPHEKQTYIRNFDGTTYNEIVEFQWEDEKTGFGYYYTVQVDVAEADKAANIAENVEKIAARREAQAARNEIRADRIEADADRAESKGYTAKSWIDAQRTEAARLRRDAEATRKAINDSNTTEEPKPANESAESVTDSKKIAESRPEGNECGQATNDGRSQVTTSTRRRTGAISPTILISALSAISRK